jgi:hypothetical protein
MTFRQTHQLRGRRKFGGVPGKNAAERRENRKFKTLGENMLGGFKEKVENQCA